MATDIKRMAEAGRVSIAYRLFYRLGFTPWDNKLPTELVDLITGPEAMPPGRALDMGSGNGGKAIYMAQHGWQVTGVENVPRALAEARRGAKVAAVTVDFRQGDVTQLDELHLDPGYSLVFDDGCYHGLKRAQRDAYGRGVNAVAAPGATFLVLGFTKARPPVPSGISTADLVEHLGSTWKVQWSHAVTDVVPPPMFRAEVACFCLKKSY